MGFSKHLSENMEYFHKKLHLDKNFDAGLSCGTHRRKKRLYLFCR